MKKIWILFLLFFFIVAATEGYVVKKTDFLGTPVSVVAGATSQNGTDFTSEHIAPLLVMGTITVNFTRTAGSSSLVYFEFQASADNGESWSTAYYLRIEIPTNETAASNAVQIIKLVNFYGISHIRLYRIVNNDASNNLTACNASLSF